MSYKKNKNRETQKDSSKNILMILEEKLEVSGYLKPSNSKNDDPFKQREQSLIFSIDSLIKQNIEISNISKKHEIKNKELTDLLEQKKSIEKTTTVETVIVSHTNYVPNQFIKAGTARQNSLANISPVPHQVT